jgi:hypothetical protein
VFLGTLHLLVHLTISAPLVHSSELLKEAEMLETFLLLPADLNDLISETLDLVKELMKGVVCVADQQDRTLSLPVALVLEKEFDNLDTDVCFSCSWRTLNQSQIIIQHVFHSSVLTMI